MIVAIAALVCAVILIIKKELLPWLAMAWWFLYFLMWLVGSGYVNR